MRWMVRVFLVSLFTGFVCLVSPIEAFAKRSSDGRGGSHSVRSHVRKDGTSVQSHRRTNPNRSKSDNWSTKGNVNPHTGKKGTKNP